MTTGCTLFVESVWLPLVVKALPRPALAYVSTFHGKVYMPKPPRMVVFVPSRYAKPARGSQLLQTPLCSVDVLLACVMAYLIAAGAMVAGLIMFGSSDRSLRLT